MLELFNIYFLVLVLIISVIVAFIDSSRFKKENRINTAIKARNIGVIYIVTAAVLFIANALR